MNHPSLAHTQHRPWPLPDAPWRWRQQWLELGFAHFRIHRNAIRHLVHPDLELEEFDGTPWITAVPFRMADLMRGQLPCPPPLRSFPQLNLRTYVRHGGKSGVWFFSLHTNCLPVILGGRLIYGTPYAFARSRRSHTGTTIHHHARSRSLDFHARYTPDGPAFESSHGSFEDWLTERYCLYATPQRHLARVDVHHRKWPLQNCTMEIHAAPLLAAAGHHPLDSPPVFHFSPGVDVVSYAPVPLIS